MQEARRKPEGLITGQLRQICFLMRDGALYDICQWVKAVSSRHVQVYPRYHGGTRYVSELLS